MRVFNKGPSLIVVKATTGRICGGYTSKHWKESRVYIRDDDAFVFSLHNNTKYTPSDYDKAIYTTSSGFSFGNGILLATSNNKLNDNNEGRCCVGTDRFYNIVADADGKSPLTGEKDKFTVSELEVY